MYKRRARIRFLATDFADRACARAAAEQLGADWVEVAAVGDGPVDLIVSLDEASAQTVNNGAVPHQHWRLKEPREADIRAKVAGLVGGMRLLARLDQSGPPGK